MEITPGQGVQVKDIEIREPLIVAVLAVIAFLLMVLQILKNLGKI